MAAAPPLDEVDRILAAEDGKIERKRDPKRCKHGANGKCIYCLPIDPFDETYLQENGIKHMSFTAYVRSLTVTKGRSSKSFKPLSNESHKIKSGCKSHPPFPAGICSTCQPAPVTLMRQKYRHVDNISFENEFLVNNFLNYWRQSGQQRIGFLLGRYEVHSDVPLGIKATVAAIYEPPQSGGPNSVELLDDPCESMVDELAASLGLKRVGWIFTDLTQEGTGVKFVRNAETYLLSGEEICTAAHFQNKYPSGCQFSTDGVFGSKFVTVVVTGDKDNQVHFEGYQVSEQCASLERDGCLFPTLDAPELAYVKESSDEQYIPDVFYRAKDEYGNDVGKVARPLPVEYLIVDVPAGMPKAQSYSFFADAVKLPFPIENRMEINQLQNFEKLCVYSRQFSEEEFLQMASDFHFLLFLLTNPIYPLSMADLMPLLTAIRNESGLTDVELRDSALQWCRSQASWRELTHLIEQQTAANPHGDSGGVGLSGSARAARWACQVCTLENSEDRPDCEACGIPRN